MEPGERRELKPRLLGPIMTRRCAHLHLIRLVAWSGRDHRGNYVVLYVVS